MSNKAFIKAKQTPNDELYTRLADIENELSLYNFKGKTIHCCCDSVRSQFVVYFVSNFKKLGIRSVIATSYSENGKGEYFSYDGINTEYKKLNGNGDMLSEEIKNIMKDCDAVVTNPPFSLFRQLVSQLEELGKQYVLIGIEGAVVYKDIFPLVKNGELHIGCNMVKEFLTPSGATQKFGNICWWTNMEYDRSRNMTIGYIDKPKKNRLFDNYNALSVDSVKEIPTNYKGVIGVPITYLKYFDWQKFRISGVTSSSVENAGSSFCGVGNTKPYQNGKMKFARLLIERV